MKILHLMIYEKFMFPFINFVKDNFDLNNHLFLFSQGIPNISIPTELKSSIKCSENIEEIKKYIDKFPKIIIHGLWDSKIIDIFFSNPQYLKKSFWVMWGGDFYFPEKQHIKKKRVIKKMGNLITDIVGDYILAKKWYKTKGKLYRSFMYPSNLYKDLKSSERRENSYIKILVGNSSNPTNNHIETLEKLKKFRDENIKVYVPLSYGGGSIGYINTVIQYGKSIFGSNFVPLTSFMPLNQYIEFLSSIDIGVFNVNRQQAVGNIISLLGFGKKVYIRDDTTMWNYFNKELNIKVFNFKEGISLEQLSGEESNTNIKKIQSYFSKENLKSQLEEIFNSN